MPNFTGEAAQLLDLARLGNAKARDQLIAHACSQLRDLTSRMLKCYPAVKRWEQTDDVLQNALLRLCRALETTKLESVRHFYNLAALQIRRELIDLAHHHMGPQGQGAKHHTERSARARDDQKDILYNQTEQGGEPDSVEAWTAFHEQVEALPDAERELFGLLWYEELTQEEAAAVLGVSLRTVKRRWQSARLLLAEVLANEPPI